MHTRLFRGINSDMKEYREGIVTVLAFERMTVEGHKGVSEYSENQVAVKMKGGTLYVTGEKLEITEINAEELILTGKIASVAREKCVKNSIK